MEKSNQKKYTFLINTTPPPRLIKRMDLVKDKFDLYAICWDKGGDEKYDFKRDFCKKEIINIDADNSNPMKRLIPTYKFSQKAYKILDRIKPDLIHVQSYDMLEIATKYKKNNDNKVKIIYEVPDIHRYLTDDKKNFPMNIVSSILKKRENNMLAFVDLMIMTSMKFWEHFDGKYSKDNLVFMPNIPNLELFKDYDKLRVKNQHDTFTVGYIGGLRYLNELKKLVKAMEGLGMNLMMAGFESGTYFKELSETKDFIEYRGKFYYDDEIAELYSKCDCIFSVYDASMKNVRIALPNKLYESIHAELPIIVARDTYLSEVVNEWNVGVAVDHESEEEMRNVLIKLRDDQSFYHSLQENCRKMQSELNPQKNNERLLKRIENLF